MKLEEAMGEKKVRLKDSYEAKELLGVAGKECVIASLRVNWRKREVIIKTKNSPFYNILVEHLTCWTLWSSCEYLKSAVKLETRGTWAKQQWLMIVLKRIEEGKKEFLDEKLLDELKVGIVMGG